MKRKLLISICVPFALAGIAGAASVLEQYLPLHMRQKYAHFAYAHLSVAPNNDEKPGVYENTPFDVNANISVAVYDGSERHVYVYRPGGDDHRLAAMQKKFHLRVNARNSRDAARMLREYLATRGFKGSISETCTFAHGSPASPRLGITKVGDELLTFLSEKKPNVGFADLYFVSCDVAQGAEGRDYIQSVADCYGLRVNASEDSIGWKVWFPPAEGRPNYYLGKENWLVATPNEKEPKRKLPSKAT